MYEFITYPEVRAQIAALPPEALGAYYEALTDHLQHAPWDGEPVHQDNPTGAVRRWLFGSEGAGMVVYLILEDQQRVDVLLVQWAG